MDVEATVIQILQEMSRIPAALKSWKTPVLDLLSDNRLFNCNPADAIKWKSIVKVLYDTDKTVLPELLGMFCRVTELRNSDYEALQESWQMQHLQISSQTGNMKCYCDR